MSTRRETAMIPKQQGGADQLSHDNYYDDVDIFDYDETVVAHPYMDALKAAIVSTLTQLYIRKGGDIAVLDAGTGSGQLARTLAGLPFIKLTACDIDPTAKSFFESHPETNSIRFTQVDLLEEAEIKSLPKMDVAILLGVFHHIPPNERSNVLRYLSEIAETVLIADEGIAEYESDVERRENARSWYTFVIDEAKRRRIVKLAELEAEFMAADTAPMRNLTDDFKESPSQICVYAESAGLTLANELRIGPWNKLKGGMYLSELSRNK